MLPIDKNLLIVFLYNLILGISVAGALGWLARRGERVRLTHLAMILIALGGWGLVSAGLFAFEVFQVSLLLAWGVFVHGTAFLLGCAALWWQKRRVWAGIAGTLCLALLLIAVDAFLIEPHWLEVTTLTLRSPKVHAPLRIVVAADIQTDHPSDYEQQALRAVFAARPDVLLFAGDYIHLGPRSESYKHEQNLLHRMLREEWITPTIGAYAVQGNIDPPRLWQETFADLPITLTNETVTLDLGPLYLTLLSLQDSGYPYNATNRSDKSDKFHLILGHVPNFALGNPPGDLLVAGHTHGGQVRLPFIGPLITASAVSRAWAAGLTEIAPEQFLLVSRGIGMERGHAAQMRFLCRPQVVIIDLLPAE